MGIGNGVGSCLRCFVTCASVARSSVQANAGGKTQVRDSLIKKYIDVD